VEYDAILCKVKTTAACAKEAYELLDAVIQNDKRLSYGAKAAGRKP